MTYDLTHASFFSGVGGLDLGLERAGWRTVSFSEIDPYASAVLAERWPGVPNLGDITELARSERVGSSGDPAGIRTRLAGPALDDERGVGWTGATLWSGGFPCQDLSVAGKRAGFGTVGVRPNRGSARTGGTIDTDQPAVEGGQRGGDRLGTSGDDGSGDRYADLTRSGLAFAFLDLVERHRPPAILLENVPGLLSSMGGRDFARLLAEVGELRYGWAYRILDAQHFGVPQRRRRVFIVCLDTERGFEADRAAEVLSVGTRCGRHPATGYPKGPNAADGLGAGISRALSTSQERIDADTESSVVRSETDASGVRAADGLAGRLDDLAPTLRVGPQKPQDGGPGDTVPVIAATINSGGNNGGFRTEPGEHLTAGGGVMDDPLLPIGLDSHRYRCCGNGVVSDVSEWVGLRLAEALR